MDNIVGFFDILGASSSVRAGRFSDLESLDFSDPVGGLARDFPSFRFAVFSDSAIISSPVSNVESYVEVVRRLYQSWFSDGVFVRAGIDIGEIRWVDWVTDELYKPLRNYSYSRVYGKALIGAYELESRSGPGALVFLSEKAAELFESSVISSTFQDTRKMLIHLNVNSMGYIPDLLQRLSVNENASEVALRHYRSTKAFVDVIENYSSNK